MASLGVALHTKDIQNNIEIRNWKAVESQIYQKLRQVTGKTMYNFMLINWNIQNSQFSRKTIIS